MDPRLRRLVGVCPRLQCVISCFRRPQHLTRESTVVFCLESFVFFTFHGPIVAVTWSYARLSILSTLAHHRSFVRQDGNMPRPPSPHVGLSFACTAKPGARPPAPFGARTPTRVGPVRTAGIGIVCLSDQKALRSRRSCLESSLKNANSWISGEMNCRRKM
jgi:hypothetical protein